MSPQKKYKIDHRSVAFNKINHRLNFYKVEDKKLTKIF